MNEIQVPLLQEIRLRWPLAGVACAVLALPSAIFPRREGWGQEGQGWKGWCLWGPLGMWPKNSGSWKCCQLEGQLFEALPCFACTLSVLFSIEVIFFIETENDRLAICFYSGYYNDYSDYSSDYSDYKLVL